MKKSFEIPAAEIVVFDKSFITLSGDEGIEMPDFDM